MEKLRFGAHPSSADQKVHLEAAAGFQQAGQQKRKFQKQLNLKPPRVDVGGHQWARQSKDLRRDQRGGGFWQKA